MKRILVAVDESDASRRAAIFVDGFFTGDDVSIVAVNVARVPVTWMPPVPFGGVQVWSAGDQARIEDAVAEVNRAGEAIAASQAPHDAEIDVVLGETVQAIQRAADDHDADLIVVGSNDKGFLQRLVSPSVAERLTRESVRPVLVVP